MSALVAPKSIVVSPLLSLELTPFSVFYLGSNHNLRVEEGGLRGVGDDRLFVKLQYLFEL